MKQKVLVRGPVLTMSGYGEQSRFALRALKAHNDKFEIFIVPLNWGNTGWTSDDTAERRWIDERIRATAQYVSAGGQFDISLQITIPNEWEEIAPINIGYTAGIEVTRTTPEWLEKSKLMDKIIVVSNHSKSVYEQSAYEAVDKKTGEKKHLKCEAPIEVVGYPVRKFDLVDLDIQLDYDFNYLIVAQWSPRKNIENTIKWFIEENIDREVGLVIKTNLQSNCKIDKEFSLDKLQSVLKKYPERTCKVYLIHGDMSTEEIHSLYNHPKIKCLVSLTHGEGFGLPLFEAAYNGLPIITSGWSGQCDFLYAPPPPKKKKSKKNKLQPYFAEVEYLIAQIPEEAAWEGVIQKDSGWCYPQEGSYKMRLRQVYNYHDKWKKKANYLQSWILKNFEEKKINNQFIDAMMRDINIEATEYVFVSDVFHNQYNGGAELSLKTLVETCPSPPTLVNSSMIDDEFIEHYKDSKWIFGNMANVNPDILSSIIDKKLDYVFIEFDYKFCKHRNPILYNFMENEECDYASTNLGKLISNFVRNSKATFFMSEAQRDIYFQQLPDTKDSNTHILSSLFDDGFFGRIELLKNKYETSERNDNWIVLGSNSWVKGALQSEAWCKDNNIEHEVIFGIEYDQFLKKLAQSKGLCSMPAGYDTCPRLVIEAKLLNCELQLNEHVQHRDEEWFNKSNDEIVKYLRTRKDYFWMHSFSD